LLSVGGEGKGHGKDEHGLKWYLTMLSAMKNEITFHKNLYLIHELSAISTSIFKSKTKYSTTNN